MKLHRRLEKWLDLLGGNFYSWWFLYSKNSPNSLACEDYNIYWELKSSLSTTLLFEIYSIFPLRYVEKDEFLPRGLISTSRIPDITIGRHSTRSVNVVRFHKTRPVVITATEQGLIQLFKVNLTFSFTSKERCFRWVKTREKTISCRTWNWRNSRSEEWKSPPMEPLFCVDLSLRSSLYIIWGKRYLIF